MLNREWGAESNGKLPYLSIASKTADLVPEFAVEYLPLSRTATLVLGFVVKNLWAEYSGDGGGGDDGIHLKKIISVYSNHKFKKNLC